MLSLKQLRLLYYLLNEFQKEYYPLETDEKTDMRFSVIRYQITLAANAKKEGEKDVQKFPQESQSQVRQKSLF